MTTITEAAPKVKTSKAGKPPAVSLTLEINGTAYAVEPINPGESGTKAYRLAKHHADGAVYDVIRTNEGICECTCADYEMRHKGIDWGTCKHGAALVLVGLLDAPKPVPVPTKPPAPKPRPKPAPAPQPAAAEARPAKVEALGWATSITGKLWEVATRAQRDHAVRLLNQDFLVGVMIEPIGPSLDELRAALAARASAEAAPAIVEPPAAGPCCDPAEAAPCVACAPAVAGPVEVPDDRAEAVGPTDPELLTLDQLIDAEAARLRRMETDAGDLMAHALAELARTVRFVAARTPAEYEARAEVLDAGR